MIPFNLTFIQENGGLQGYTLIFLFLLKNIDCGYLKNIRIFYLKIFIFGGKISSIFE